MTARAAARRLALVTLASSLVSAIAASASTGTASIRDDEADTSAHPAADVVMESFAPADFAEQAGALPKDLVEAVQRDLDISAEQYLARAAAAKAANDVLDSLDDVVSAAWLEGQTLNVSVQDRSVEQQVAATGAEVHVGDALSDAVKAARSQGRLVYADRELDEVISIESDFISAQQHSADPPEEADVDSEIALRGGYSYTLEDSSELYRCTAGFNGTDDGAPRSLTAGHCARGDEGLLSGPVNLLGLSLLGDSEDDGGGGLLGDIGVGSEDDEHEHDDHVVEFASEDVHFGDGDDAAILDVDDDVTLRPEVASTTGAGEQGAGLPIYDSIDAVPGAPACQSGAASGWTCGLILDAQVTVPVSGEDVSGFMLNACTLPGDGGGAIVVGSYALGVSSGTTWSGTDCHDHADHVSSRAAMGYSLSGGENSAAGLYGDDWQLSIHVGDPEVVAPASGDATGERPTFHGTVAAAAGATIVVRVDDDETYETEVQLDGTWQVPVEEPLSAGEHSYTVTASHTGQTAGETTSSETVSGTFEVAEVASLVVRTPMDSETTTITQPRFVGTGEPGARITLEFDDEQAATTVDGDGTWTVSPSEAQRAGRFDATVVQKTDDDTTGEVSVKDIGIVPGAPLITEATENIDEGHVIAGTAVPGSTIALRLTPEQVAADVPTGEYLATADEAGVWQVELDGLAAGEYTVNAVQAVDDLTSERSTDVPLEVSQAPTGASRAADVDDDLAQTGDSPLLLLGAAAALLGLGVLGVVLVRRPGFLRR